MLDDTPAIGTIVTSTTGEGIMRGGQSLDFIHNGLTYWGGVGLSAVLFIVIAPMCIPMYILTGSCMRLPLLIG